MADPKTINQLTDIGSALVDSDEIEVQRSGQTTTKKSLLSRIKTYILGSATIGGSAAGDIPTNSSTGTFTNKRFTTPKLNEDVAIARTATDLNACGNLTTARVLVSDANGRVSVSGTTTTEVGMLSGISGNIETRLTSLESSTYNPLNQTFTYGYGFSTEALQTTLERTQAQILTDLGLSTSSYVIDPTSIIAHLWRVNEGIYQNIVLAAGAEDCNFTTQTINSQLQMNTFKLTDLTAEKQYNLTLTLKVLAKAGV